MSTRELDGVLAIRESWCRPDEPILVCVPSLLSQVNVGFDVTGRDWNGRPQRGLGSRTVVGIGNAAGDAILWSTENEGASPPTVIVFGPQHDCLAATLMMPRLQWNRLGWWVLTPFRLGWVSVSPEPDAPAAKQPAGPTPERSLFDRARSLGEGIRDFGRDARNVLAGRSPYPPGQSIEVARVAGEFEVPAQQIAGVGVAARKLPKSSIVRDAHCLRVSLVDGSGFDFYAGRRPEEAQRLSAMASNR